MANKPTCEIACLVTRPRLRDAYPQLAERHTRACDLGQIGLAEPGEYLDAREHEVRHNRGVMRVRGWGGELL